MEFESTFGTAAPLLGMVHLPPLPGAPRAPDDGREAMRAAVDRAASDARALDRGGVDGIVIENFGDAPFYPDEVPPHVVAAVTRAATAVAAETDLPLGINVLRNDAEAALSVAAAVGADFVRVNVHTGARVTDQGIVQGRAHQTLRLRDRLGVDVGVFADTDVKHSAPLTPEGHTAESFADTAERGLADAVIASGAGTGEAVDTEALEAVVAERERHGLDTPVLVGSGVTPETVADLLGVADGAVVGTALKENGETTAPVDADRVARLVAAADAVR
ncbi:BtpA/SgcQ family protein [Halorubrum sp. SP3]|uniref:BtpA/SgcQ family protein n=1 Tax=unclassified Halorubrum TaxID=2642239 RepID=UPI0010F47B6B|nr:MULTISPECIES: BtpA/SgcQ family protein [unclassified Halorubrum]TKX54781.1 BtpA/SgcQ family protein [Halorubrum sp. SP3]TKX69890.1 BtpA/SgcQ family protein [Halorubrum sp. SP9]